MIAMRIILGETTVGTAEVLLTNQLPYPFENQILWIMMVHYGDHLIYETNEGKDVTIRSR